MKVGSLFDGSGGFPLAASICGIRPVWASEVEPYPIAVTKSRFPEMVHIGNVQDIHGGEIEPVDVITSGSPCQDMSIAGKRAGLKHEGNGDEDTTRSGLFMEAIRIIKEMREATDGVYPRFAVWENVTGAFSSNKGEDFRLVLQEFIKIIEPQAVMPSVPKNGWAYADSYRGDGWSLAYRVFDAQYWGVPQRRRRIYLVADFAGTSAGKILFESEGLSGYSAEGFRAWQGAARNAAACPNAAGFDGYNGDLTGDVSSTLGVNCGISTGRNGIVIVQQESAVYSMATGSYTQVIEDRAPTLMARDYKGPTAVASSEPQYSVRRLTPTECARLQGFPDWWGTPEHKENFTEDEYNFWLDVRNTHAKINGKAELEYSKESMLKWYNKLHTDSAEYKMWGNGIALPCALYVMEGIAEVVENAKKD